jgi:NAD+ synthase
MSYREDFDSRAETREIAGWLQNYNANAGTNGYVVGLSGGIDSTLVAALAVKAVGKKKVIGVIMPLYSPGADEADAYRVAKFLGIETVFYDMRETYNAMVEESPIELGRLEKANIRSRLRMTFLYAVAGKNNMLVAGTGNKSEDMVGYFTKYGDGGVDILPIAEYYKWEVKKMARYLKVPGDLVERTPTAALWEGQTDEKDLGMTYDVLDSILYYLETGKEYPIKYAYEVQKVKKMIKQNEHKTKYPPIYRR